MRIKRIKLENVRCFERQEINIPQDINVLVGRNGSGKSTVLKALITVYIHFWGLGQNREFVDNLFDDQDIRYGKSHLSVDVDFIFNEEEASVMGCSEFTAHLIRSENQFMIMLPESIVEEDEINQYLDLIRRFWTVIRKSKILYFDAYRFMAKDELQGPIIGEKKKENLPLVQSNINKSGKSTNKVLNLKQWLINIDYIRLKNTDNQYELLYQHLIKAFDLLLHPLVYHGIDEKGNIIFWDQETGIPVEIDSLSDGFKSVFQMVVATMKLLFEDTSEDDLFYMNEGVVLIDEIDCHIHPRWQRNILASFRELFPKCQFIVTTHSPYILESVNDDEIIRIGEKPIE